MSVRCMQCGAVHQTEPLPFCACGSVRFVLVDAAELVAGGANVGPDSSAAGDELDDDELDQAPPATPRDMPEQGEAETADVAALRPDPDKEAHLCSQHGCYEPATHRFTWPGHPESRACYAHGAAATRLADAMGFFLEVPAL